jgi:predicted TPR repeat methyltransferase
VPYSYQFFDQEVVGVVNHLAPKTVLDVGPGAGKWGHYLRAPGRTIDAIEIFPKYIDEFNLRLIYNEVFTGDICKFPGLPNYQLIVMGDILEHLTVEQSHDLLARIAEAKAAVLILVPFGYEQGECHGNVHETHHQPELTETLFGIRYPGFTTLFTNHLQGVFFRPGRK